MGDSHSIFRPRETGKSFLVPKVNPVDSRISAPSSSKRSYHAIDIGVTFVGSEWILLDVDHREVLFRSLNIDDCIDKINSYLIELSDKNVLNVYIFDESFNVIDVVEGVSRGDKLKVSYSKETVEYS